MAVTAGLPLLGDGEYLKDVRYFRVAGTDEEIGSQLAAIGAQYGVTFAKYQNATFKEARTDYFARNWPPFHRRMLGVEAYRRKQGAAIDVLDDTGALLYDVPADGRKKADLREGMGCSAAFLPTAMTGGAPIVARNYDAWRLKPEWYFDGADVGTYAGRLFQRPFVVELQPTGARRVIALGGHDLLCPFQDALNDRGLFITSLADRPPLTEHMQLAGGSNTGLSSRQVPLLLASECDDVAAAKREILRHQVQMDFGFQWLIADAQGGATVFAIDRHGCFSFTDARPDQPLPVTNHPLSPDGGEAAAEHSRPDKHYDSFARLARLEGALGAGRLPWDKPAIERLMDQVVCAYEDLAAAGAQRRQTLTLWTLIADLQRRRIEVGFFRSSKPGHPRIKNRKSVEWKKWRIGFGSQPEDLGSAETP